jgi:hypothetical protein
MGQGPGPVTHDRGSPTEHTRDRPTASPAVLIRAETQYKYKKALKQKDCTLHEEQFGPKNKDDAKKRAKRGLPNSF